MKLIDKLVLIHIVDRKVLFVRSYNEEFFYTAGGKREQGETDEQALVREIRQELDVELDPSSMKFLETFFDPVHDKPELTLKLTCYSAKITGDPHPSSEIEEMAWIDTSTTIKITPTGKKVLQFLKDKGLID